MALTALLTAQTVPGADKLVGVNLTPDNSYPAGGYNLNVVGNLALGISVVRRIIGIRVDNFAGAPYIPNLVPTYGGFGAIVALTLRFVVCNTGAEVATGTDLSATKYHMLLEGN